MNDAVIERLADLLVRDEPVLLSAEERELIRTALTALGESEKRVGHLQRVLSVQGAALERVESAATGALPTNPDAPVYDFAAADGARAAFEAKLRAATTTSSVVAAALAFARDAAVLGS